LNDFVRPAGYAFTISKRMRLVDLIGVFQSDNPWVYWLERIPSC